MLQRIRLHTRDGVREYPIVPSAAALQAAAVDGEIAVGDDIIYREWICWVMEDIELLILDSLRNVVPVQPIGAGPEFVPPMGGWNAAPDGMQWSFTVNGQPVTPEQMAQYMGGQM